MPKVLISDKLSPAAVEIFRNRGIDVDLKPGLSPADLRAIVGEYDGLAIRSATKVTKELLDAATKLKVVGRAGIGVDNVDIKSATARGVVVMNTPHGNTITTAEHAIAMMFALARQIPEATTSTKAGKWEKNRFMGVELTAKTLGLIGCGNIGSIVADRAVALKMRVLAYDPYLSEKKALELGVEKTDLDTLLARADFITLHTPLTDATRNILSREALAKTKKGVRIINCARGGLVDEAALADAIKSGPRRRRRARCVRNRTGHRLAAVRVGERRLHPASGCRHGRGAGERRPPSGRTDERFSAHWRGDQCHQHGLGVGRGRPAAEAVSGTLPPAGCVRRSADPGARGGDQQGHHRIRGPGGGADTRPLTAAMLAGLMSPLMEGVNMVNAAIVARDHGIDVAETVHDRPTEYLTLVRVTVQTAGLVRSVAGTLFAGSRPRIVEIKGIKVEADFAPYMLYVTNQDKPGFIGRFGATLAGAGINIATFHLGRAEQGGDAICLVSVDEPVPEPVLEMVRTLPLVMQATGLAF